MLVTFGCTLVKVNKTQPMQLNVQKHSKDDIDVANKNIYGQ